MSFHQRGPMCTCEDCYLTKWPETKAPSAFTEAKLQRLEEDLEIPERTMIVDEHEMRAILTRLKAAELTVRHFAPYLPLQNLKECATYQAWLRSKGEAA